MHRNASSRFVYSRENITQGPPVIPLSIYFKVIGGPPVTGAPVGSRTEEALFGINMSPFIL